MNTNQQAASAQSAASQRSIAPDAALTAPTAAIASATDDLLYRRIDQLNRVKDAAELLIMAYRQLPADIAVYVLNRQIYNLMLTIQEVDHHASV